MLSVTSASVLLGLLATICLVFFVIRRRRNQNAGQSPTSANVKALTKPHSHQHPQGKAPAGSLVPAPGDFSAIHKGKARAGGCKFDEAEVRRTQNFRKPKIDTTNLPKPDP